MPLFEVVLNEIIGYLEWSFKLLPKRILFAKASKISANLLWPKIKTETSLVLLQKERVLGFYESTKKGLQNEYLNSKVANDTFC